MWSVENAGLLVSRLPIPKGPSTQTSGYPKKKPEYWLAQATNGKGPSEPSPPVKDVGNTFLYGLCRVLHKLLEEAFMVWVYLAP